MAETIKGINVVIGAETTGLSAALHDVNKRARDIQAELKQVERLLKLDPTNTELIAQKQQLLAQAVENTREKLNRLKSVQEQVNEQFARGEISEGQYRAFQREVVKTEQELRSLEKQLSEVTGEVKAQGEQVSRLGKEYQEAFEEAKQSLGNVYEQTKKVGAAITAAGAAITAGLGVAVGKAADFEQAMANVYSVMAPDEVEQFRDELKDLALVMGAETKYSATEAARGIEELVKAGVSVQDILEGGLAGALSLATAGELELADAAEIASTALNAFRDDAISVQDAADILAGAANASATSVQELKFGLSQVSAVASAVGLSFEDTATALAVFAQNGLKGSDAGTSLKTMLMRLQPDTKEAKAAFEDLGLFVYETEKAFNWLAEKGITPASTSLSDIRKAIGDYIEQSGIAKRGTSAFSKAFEEIEESIGYVRSAFVDANGQFVDMATMADILRNSMVNLTDAQRLQYLQTIFGADAVRAANILYKEGAAGINSMAEAMSKISAADVAAQKMDTFKGALEELSGSLETAQISIGSALIPALRMLTGIIQTVVDGFNSLPPGVQSAVAVIGALVAALALIGGPMLLLIGFLPQIAAGFAMIAPVISTVGTAIAGLAGPIGIAIAAITAIAAAAFLVIKNWEPIKEFFVGLWDTVSSATSAAWESIKSGLSSAWESIKSAASSTFEAIATFLTNVWNGIVSFLTGVWNGLSSAAQTAFTAIVDVVRPIMDGFRTFFSGIWEAIKNIFVGALLLIINLVTGDFERLRKDTIAIWENLKNAFFNIWEGIKQIFIGALELLESILAEAWARIQETAASAWEQFRAVVREILDSLITWIKTTWNSLIAWFWELPGTLYAIGVEMFNQMRIAVETTVVGVVEAIKTGIGKALEWLASLPETAYQYGRDMMQGFIDGIKSMIQRVIETVSDLVDRVKSILRRALRIDSPSKVMREYGRYTGEGFALGIKDSIDYVKQQATALAAAAIPGEVQTKPSVSTATAAEGPAQRTIIQNVTIQAPTPLSPSETARQLQRVSRQLAMEWGI